MYCTKVRAGCLLLFLTIIRTHGGVHAQKTVTPFDSGITVFVLRLSVDYLPIFSKKSVLLICKFRRIFFTMNSGIGSMCVWIIIGLVNPSFRHFSCPPSVLTYSQPHAPKKARMVANEILDNFCVDIREKQIHVKHSVGEQSNEYPYDSCDY